MLFEPADEIETELFSKDEVVFTFMSDYGEEDIFDSFPESWGLATHFLQTEHYII